jgi:hypothetical protein
MTSPLCIATARALALHGQGRRFPPSKRSIGVHFFVVVTHAQALALGQIRNEDC